MKSYSTFSTPEDDGSDGLTGMEEKGCIGGGTSTDGSSPSSPFDVNRLPASVCLAGSSNWFRSDCPTPAVALLPLPPILLPIPDSAVFDADPAAES